MKRLLLMLAVFFSMLCQAADATSIDYEPFYTFNDSSTYTSDTASDAENASARCYHFYLNSYFDFIKLGPLTIEPARRFYTCIIRYRAPGEPLQNGIDVSGLPSCQANDELIHGVDQSLGYVVLICRNRSGCKDQEVFNGETKSCERPIESNDFTQIQQEKTPANECGDSTGMPIKFASGKKVLTELDYKFNSIIGPSFVKNYTSRLNGGALLGRNWLSNMQTQIYAPTTNILAGMQAMVVSAQGAKIPFTYNGSLILH